MARLPPRQHIPLRVRCIVASRQLGIDPPTSQAYGKVLRARLTVLAGFLGCPVEDLRLDHDPALENREKVLDCDGEVLRYIPDELDPDHLIYREKHDHHIKTNVRGEHGQRADNVIAKRERRRQKKAQGTPAWRKKIAGRSQWPKGRKIRSRGFGRKSV